MENKSHLLLDNRTISIGKRIKELRVAKKYTSAEGFAIAHDLARASYELQERGKRNMTLSSLYKILDIHKISLIDFFAGVVYADNCK